MEIIFSDEMSPIDKTECLEIINFFQQKLNISPICVEVDFLDNCVEFVWEYNKKRLIVVKEIGNDNHSWCIRDLLNNNQESGYFELSNMDVIQTV